MAAEPEGLGFFEAAVTIASRMRMNLWTIAGRTVVGARVDIPVRFALRDGKP